jgi:hypothetical protein
MTTKIELHIMINFSGFISVQVAERFLKAVKQSLHPAPGMSFFINCYDEDVLKQAELSTSRYRKGSGFHSQL